MGVTILAAIFWVMVTYGRLNSYVTGIILILLLGECIVSKHSHHHHGINIVETLSNKSLMRSVHPTSKLLITVGLLCFLIGSQNIYASIFVIISIVIFMLKQQGLKYHQVKDLFSTPLIFIFISTIGIIISVSRQMGEYNLKIGSYYLVLSEQSQSQGATLALVSIASVSLLINFAVTTPIGDLIFALKQLRVPKILIEIMYFIYRYIITLSSLLRNMQNSAQSRLGFINQKRTFKTSIMIAAKLFQQSLQLSLESLSAMESRMYQGELQFLYRDFEVKQPLILMTIYSGIVISIAYIGGLAR